MNKKEDFLKHELKIYHKRDNKSNKIKEEKIKIQKEKIKKKSETLKKVLISFFKENGKESYTANGIKTKLNCQIRLTSLKEELENLKSEEILKCKIGFKNYKYYKFNKDFVSNETKKIIEIDDSKNEKEENNKIEEENNSDTGEFDDSNFYDIPTTHN